MWTYPFSYLNIVQWVRIWILFRFQLKVFHYVWFEEATRISIDNYDIIVYDLVYANYLVYIVHIVNGLHLLEFKLDFVCKW